MTHSDFVEEIDKAALVQLELAFQCANLHEIGDHKFITKLRKVIPLTWFLDLWIEAMAQDETFTDDEYNLLFDRLRSYSKLIML